jgi:hypothetical protein
MIFQEKSSNIKFNQNPSNGNQVVPWGRMDKTDRQMDMTKLIVAFHKFANTPTKRVGNLDLS